MIIYTFIRKDKKEELNHVLELLIMTNIEKGIAQKESELVRLKAKAQNLEIENRAKNCD